MRGVVEHSKVRELHAVRRSDLHCRREAEARLVAAEIEIVGGEHDRPVDAARGEVRPAARVVALEHHVIDREIEPPHRRAAAVGIRGDQAKHVTEQPVVQPSAVTMMTKDAALSAALRATLAAAERTSAAHRRLPAVSGAARALVVNRRHRLAVGHHLCRYRRAGYG